MQLFELKHVISITILSSTRSVKAFYFILSLLDKSKLRLIFVALFIYFILFFLIIYFYRYSMPLRTSLQNQVKYYQRIQI